jgi:uncharacterized protein
MAMNDPNATGYSREEEYFFKRNKELIERKRKELDAQRAEEQKADGHPANWMRCPKCGEPLEEVRLAQIAVDKCGQCQGVFFDQGELDTLLQSQEPQGFLSGLKRLLR